MLRIRFFRVGKKNQPCFRVVATDKKNPTKAGRFLEILGFYSPLTKEKNLKKERVLHWLKLGAQPSDTVHNFLVKEGILQGGKRDVGARAKKGKSPAPAEKPAETKKAEVKKGEVAENNGGKILQQPKEKPQEAPPESSAQ